MEPVFCPQCMHRVVPSVITRSEVLPVRDEEIAVEAAVAVCPECHEDVFVEQLDEETLLRAFAEYRRRHHLLSPEEIKAIRGKYGLGQRAFSLLMGWGEVTLHRYESGSLQDGAHDAQLRMAEVPSNMRILLESSGQRLTKRQRAALDARLEKLVSGLTCPENTAQGDRAPGGIADVFSGYRRFDRTKFLEMVVYFADRPLMFKTKLNKLLFYADFLHFKEHSVSISGARYLAFQRGPVPEHYDWLTAALVDSADLTVEEVSGERWSGEVLVAQRKPDMTLFNDAERRSIERVADCLANLSSTRLSELSHTESAYGQTELGGAISYQLATELTIQLLESVGKEGARDVSDATPNRVREMTTEVLQRLRENIVRIWSSQEPGALSQVFAYSPARARIAFTPSLVQQALAPSMAARVADESHGRERHPGDQVSLERGKPGGRQNEVQPSGKRFPYLVATPASIVPSTAAMSPEDSQQLVASADSLLLAREAFSAAGDDLNEAEVDISLWQLLSSVGNQPESEEVVKRAWIAIVAGDSCGHGGSGPAGGGKVAP